MVQTTQSELPALTTIGPRHAAYALSIVARLAASAPHEHLDLVQEILWQAHKSTLATTASGKPALEPRALLFGITKHVVYNWIRRKTTERETIKALSTNALALQESAEHDYTECQRRQVVKEAVELIPEVYRYVFVRCELDGAPMAVVAAELSLQSVNTGYTRLHKGRACFNQAARMLLARLRVKNENDI